MRIFTQLLFTTVILFCLGSCSTHSPSEDFSESEKTLVINENEFVSSLHPHQAINAINIRLASQIFEGLTRFNTQGDSVELCLASAFSLNSNKTIYTFTIKPAEFHPNNCFGTKESRSVSAYDFEYCFNTLLKNNNEPSLRYIFNGNIKEVKALNKTTLRISLEKPDLLFLEKLATPAGYVYPEEAAHYYRNRLALNPVGTGPFYVAKSNNIIENHVIKLHKHKNYHLPELPKVDAVIFRFVSDKQTEYEEFINGNIDLIHHLDSATWNTFITLSRNKKGDYHFQTQEELSLLTLGFNLTNRMAANSAFRKGLSYAIDGNAVVENPSEDLLPFGESVFQFQYNPDSANLLLSEIEEFENWNGTTLPLTITDPTTAKTANAIKKLIELHTHKHLEFNALPMVHYERELIDNNQPLYFSSFDFAYPSAENLALSLLFQHKPYPNLSKFDNYNLKQLVNRSTSYDSAYVSQLFEIIHTQKPFIPLTYKTNKSISQYRIKNLIWSKLPYLDLRTVDIIEPQITFPVQ